MANIKTITNPVLIRLAHKAGVKRLSGPLYDTVRSVLLEELRDCLKNVVTYTETARRKTVQIDDVSSALGVYSSHASNRRYPQYNKQTSSDEPTRKINHKPGTVVNRDIRRLQKQYNCLYIPKLTFETLVRNIVSEYADGFRLQEKAVVLLQHYTENMLLKLFRTANHVATSAGRQTLQPEDVKLVRYITRSLSNVGAPLLLAQAKFRIYIYKTLKQVHPKMSISANVNEQLNHALNLLGNRLAERATHLTSVNNKRTLSEREVKSAVRIVFSGDLAKHAVKEGEKAVEKYVSSKGEKKSKKKEPTSAASRAGLVFPPSRARKLLANRTTQMGETASVFLAAVLEYVSAEVLELSGNAACDNKRSTIQARHLQSAVEGDKELSTLAASIGFEVVGGGVVKESESADSEEADEDADSDVDEDENEDDNIDDVSDDEDESDKKSSKKATKGTKGAKEKKAAAKKGTKGKGKKTAAKKGTKGTKGTKSTKGKGKKTAAKKGTKGTKGTKGKGKKTATKKTVKKDTKKAAKKDTKKAPKKTAKGKKGTKSKKAKSK
jgi:histone H3/H4